MSTTFKQDFKQTLIAINAFANATGDYYYLCDLTDSIITFSNNTQEIFDAISISSLSLNLQEWHKNIHERDLNKFIITANKLKNNEISDYSINFRIKNTTEIQWLNSKGKIFTSPKTNKQYLLGKITLLENPTNSLNLNLKAIKKLLSQAINNHEKGYLALFGIDNLKNINIQHGRKYGDTIISDVNKILQDEIEHAKIKRISGDNFACIILNQNRNYIIKQFNLISSRLTNQCTLSCGCVSLNKYYTNDENTLLQYAESALYQAKIAGKNTLHFFTPEDYEEKLHELELVDEIKQNMANDFCGFNLLYQPQVHGYSFEIVGAEALLRYSRNNGENISTAKLIDLLEKYELIYQVGLWVLKNAIKQCMIWRKTIPYFNISVNLSLKQFTNSIEEDVLSLINQFPEESFLTLELTESSELLNYPFINDILTSWKKHHIRISIDDFGTGYSSLARLQNMSIDEIKIDRSFVSDIHNNVYNYKLVNNIIELANSFQINVCCEGIESIEELKIINQLKPAFLQGHLFSKPIDAISFTNKFVNAKNNYFSYLQLYEKNISLDLFDSKPLANLVLDSDNDIFYISDMETYDLYYLNKAGQKLFDCKNYLGKKCYKVLHGNDKPCTFCTNDKLKYDSFYVWENNNTYCNHNFLLKDKAINYHGKKLRLEIALDITNREYVSQHAKEKLTFAEKIRSYVEALSSKNNFEDAVNQVLADVGDFYQADRAYLFENDPLNADHWNNTFEWCAENVTSQKDNLQHVAPKYLARWMKEFTNDHSIIILNIDNVKNELYEEWEILTSQNIQRLIAVPIILHGTVIGFVGVDNPRYSIADDTHVRVLASFLLSRIRQNNLQYRYEILLKESDQDILKLLNIGFWTIIHNKNNKEKNELIGNDVVEELIGMPQNVDPMTFFTICKDKLSPKDKDIIVNALNKMQIEKKPQKFSFNWHHPNKGNIQVSCYGAVSEENDDYIKFKGYCRT
ncbi:MAG: EAL domain-containing protein [Erysipelotrichaceae bacterium]|nr:EAL domain-containing protein [Erysipelotrichaceae bacterium]MDY5251571.1 EAL domain-containing protein [Erysipelotrichaceae bacterium]